MWNRCSDSAVITRRSQNDFNVESDVEFLMKPSISEIKHKFFAYRNGVVADALRRSGMPYRMIFGVDIPTLSTIARDTGYDETLADQLMADTEVRESRLLSFYLFDPEKLPLEKAVMICKSVQTREEADILAFRLLRRLPYAQELLQEISRLEECKSVRASLSKNLNN